MRQYGATVIALDINEEAAKLTEKMIIDADGTAMAAKADITDRVQVHTVIEDVIARFKKIDVLVNNAGSTRLGTMVDLEDSTYDFIINLNMKGPFIMSTEVAKVMIPRRSGRIINITSYCAVRGEFANAPYCMAKAGIKMMTQVQALELGQYGISAVAVARGTPIRNFCKMHSANVPNWRERPSKKYMQQQERRCQWDV